MLASIKTEAQWEEFQYYFNKVHPDFYIRPRHRSSGSYAKKREGFAR